MHVCVCMRERERARMHVCMCVCERGRELMYAYVHVCIYMCVYINMHTVCIFTRAYGDIHIYIYIYIHVYICEDKVEDPFFKPA